ncbi:hypothetical protein PR048_003306 [Dryococelus australis]|uniref:Reverse transcriptase RNase H-like domain-containing protein n=1 Tax=Dryococelus australis TaxID=614101 RepID=A0ABQ9IMM6_9NEOP|nr:hypothetical protein PR048_003306 [Dryococelus australis]
MRKYQCCLLPALTSSEQNYSQLEREVVAIILGYLYRMKFLLKTGHQSLKTISSPDKGIPTL